MERLKAAIIGAGNISGIYLTNLLHIFSDTIELGEMQPYNVSEKKNKSNGEIHRSIK
ncbi:hypothetical protein Holit_03432 [Hollandina sp. SP2]